MHTQILHIQKSEHSQIHMIYIFILPLVFFGLVIVGYFLTYELHSNYFTNFTSTNTLEGGDTN